MATGQISQVSLAPVTAPVSTGAERGQISQVSVSGVTFGNTSFGQVSGLRVSSVTGNLPPIISVNPTSLTVDAGAEFTLTGYDSDTDGVVVSRQWTLNDVPVANDSILLQRAPVPSVNPQILTYTFTVTDDDGNGVALDVDVLVRRAPIVIKNADGTLSGRVIRTYSSEELAALQAGPLGPSVDSVQANRTLIGSIMGTQINDTVPVVADANSGFTLVQNGTGNTWAYMAAARMGALNGLRLTQAGANVSNAYVDFTNTDPVYAFRIPIRFNADQTGTAVTTFYRLYPDATHGTPNATYISLSRTATRQLRVLENGTGGLDLTSTATLATGSDLVIMGLINSTTKALTVRVYQRGSSTLLFELTGTLLAPFVVQSLRFGNGNGNSLTSLDTNNWFAWGRGTWLPRPDISDVKPGVLDTGRFGGTLLRYPLTGQRGDYVITTADTINDTEVFGCVQVQHSGVNLDNLLVRGRSSYSAVTALIDCNSTSATSTVITNTTVVPDVPSPFTVGIDGSNWTARRVDLYNLQDAVRMRGAGCVLEDSWLHDLTYFIVTADRATSLQTHNDLIQLIGAVSPRIRRNLLDARYGPAGQYQPGVNTDTSVYGANNTHPELSALMFNISSSGVPTTGAVIEDNWIFGGYTPMNSGDPGEAGANLGRFYRNLFDSADKRGTPLITLRFLASQVVDTGVGTVNANRWYDGPSVGQEVTVRIDGVSSTNAPVSASGSSSAASTGVLPTGGLAAISTSAPTYPTGTNTFSVDSARTTL